jgi:hypothetical protein
VLGYIDASRGTRSAQLSDALSELTGSEWRSVRMIPYRALRLYRRVGPAALLILKPDESVGHWIVVRRGVVFDPEMKTPLAVCDYERRGWKVLVEVAT